MKKAFFLTLFPIISLAQGSLNGYVKDKLTGEPLIGVSVGILQQKNYTTTNNYGYYAINSTNSSNYEIEFRFLGYKTLILKVEKKEGRKDIELEEDTKELGTVNVTSESLNQSARLTVGIKLNIKQVKEIPAILGEKDIIKAIQFLPGVQRGAEGSSAFFVRGGSGDQNLLILDDAVVYNANHFFGFFSIFNPDAIKNVEFYKGGFPARFGGRLSSIIDIQMKEGNRQGFHGEGGIGILSSRLTLEGPIKKNKSSFIVSGRRTYLDPILYLIGSERSRFNYNFYDLNAKVNIDLGLKNKLFLSGYSGNDNLTVTEIIKNSFGVKTFISKIGWGNATFTTRWNHLFNQKLFVNTTATFTNYASNLIGTADLKSPTDTTFRKDAFSTLMRDFAVKADFEYYPNSKNQFRFGANLINHLFVPTDYEVNNVKFNNSNKEVYNTIEAGLYLENIFKLTDQFLLHSGLRFNTFFTKNKTYFMPEPRFSLSYVTKSDYFFKASYSILNQYINLLTNNTQGLSSDLWVPATDKFAPQRSQIYAVGLEKSLFKNKIAFSWETYYKKLERLIAVKEGSKIVGFGASPAEFLWEENVTSGKGISYGSEWMIRKTNGLLTGLASYTLSKTVNIFEELNQGKPFYPKQDIRHNFNITAAYELTKHIKISGNWLYTSGVPVTIPLGFFSGFLSQTGEIAGYSPYYLAYYGGRNNFRTPPYHRLDLGVQFNKKKKRIERTWEVSIFNVYNRRNVFYYSTNTQTSTTERGFVYQNRANSLLPIIPSVSYSFKF
jgi:hypothetical protein